MNNAASFRARTAEIAAFFVCAGFVSHIASAEPEPTQAKDGQSTAATTTEETPEEYNNWIELGIGGLIIHGDEAQFKQEHRMSGDVFGGIQDLHYEQTVGKNATLSVDGHAIWDNNDYGIKIDLTQPGLGYIRAGFDEFRSWYDGNGGFFPPHGGTWFAPRFPEMHIDRGDAWIELGLRSPDWPEITIRYSHEFRDGQKDSTVWGDTTLTGLAVNPTRKMIPSFRDIDETRDIFAFDISKTFDNTDVLLGMRYEHNENNDTLNMEQGAGQLPPVVPPPGSQRFVTQRQNDNVDLFSGHGITETRFSDTLWFTAGYSYTTLGNDLSGTRIFGTDFDAAFGEPVPTLGSRDHAFIDLAGTAEVKEHLVNANLFWMPLPSLTVLTGFRYTHEDMDSDSTFLAEEPVPNTPPFTSTNPMGGFHYGPPIPTSGARSADYDRFAQRLESRYTGIADWLFYAQGEWEEEWGHVAEFQTMNLIAPSLHKDTDSLGQKYTIGANWYPTMTLDVSGQYYHKIASYNEDITTAQFPRLLDQDWNTDDMNVRITYRPKMPAWLGTVSCITRYDFVRTTIDGQWAVFSNGELLAEEQTGVIKQHVITEAITWNPLARLYLQANASYTLNETDTPANNINLTPNTSPTVVNFRNDYWTVTGSVGYLLDDKTNLNADYSFYRANDYFNNSAVALPYGMGATENTVTAGISRQITKQVRLSIKYSYFDYTDETFGGHNNYRVHSVYSGFQYRF